MECPQMHLYLYTHASIVRKSLTCFSKHLNYRVSSHKHE